jgi:hypothetical protein
MPLREVVPLASGVGSFVSACLHPTPKTATRESSGASRLTSVVLPT